MADPHFLAIAQLFQRELRQYGLQPVELKEQDAESDGWWARIATWAPNRPYIGLFFDRLLGDRHRHFWFGFCSTERRIKRLSGEAPQGLQNWAVLTSDDFDSSGSLKDNARTRVHNSRGLAYERYEDDEHYIGKYNLGVNATYDERLVPEWADFIGGIVEYIQPELGTDVDINEIKKRRDISERTRKQLIDARRGQGEFRRGLLQKWGGCSVTRCSVNEVLRASHIKPWKAASDQERVDPNNGLLLTATLDALFDRGLISFENKGNMIVSSRLRDDACLILLPHERNLIREPSDCQQEYLAWHRREVLRG
jgi:hypothetical protein